MESQKGITMMSLVIYVSSFLIIAGIIAALTTFFYNNTALIDSQTYSAAEYNKINAYLVKESEEKDNRIDSIELINGSDLVSSISFTNRR